MNIVADSCVIVATVKPEEPHHRRSVQFLQHVRERGDELWEPMTVLWEVGSALDHPVKTPAGTKFYKEFGFNFHTIPIDEGLFQRAWKPDLRIAVKAADRIFLSCALDKNAVLVSWDNSLVGHAKALGLRASTPEEYISSHI